MIKKDNAIAATIVFALFALAILITSSGQYTQISGLLLLASGTTSITFSDRIAQAINSINQTTYTKRLPIIWGIGVVIIGLAVLFGLA